MARDRSTPIRAALVHAWRKLLDSSARASRQAQILVAAARRLRGWGGRGWQATARPRRGLGSTLIALLVATHGQGRRILRRAGAHVASARVSSRRRLPSQRSPSADPAPGYVVLEVSPSDELPAIRAMLNRSPRETVVLRVRRGNVVLASTLGMRQLRRYIDARRLPVIVESRSGILRRFAWEHDIVAVRSVGRRQVRDGRLLPRYLPLGALRLPLPALGLLARIVSVVLIALSGLVALALLGPSATVTVAPVLTPTSVSLAIIARVVEEGEIPQSGVLPASRLSVAITTSDAAVTTGAVRVPDLAAGGVVQFENGAGAAVEIPGGTRLATLGRVVFWTQRGATLAAGVGSTVLVPVVAEQPGDAGNLPARSVLTLESPLADQVTVSNPTALGGGSEREARGARQFDVDRLRETARSLALARGREALTAQFGDRFVLFLESVRVEVEREELRPALGEPGDVVDLTSVATVSALGMELGTIRDLAAREIRRRNGSGFVVVGESLTPRPTGESAVYDAEADTIQFNMLVDGNIATVVVEAAVKRAVRGKRPARAEALLNDSLTLRAPAEVQVSPGWIPMLSPFTFRIKVRIVDTALPAAGPG